MLMPTPVPQKGWEIVGAYLAGIFLGIPALLIFIIIHLGVVDMACDCVPLGIFPDWATGSRIIAAIFTGVPLGLADWFVWTRWRSHRLETRLARAYREKHMHPLLRTVNAPTDDE